MCEPFFPFSSFLFWCSVSFHCCWWLFDSMLTLAIIKTVGILYSYVFENEGLRFFSNFSDLMDFFFFFLFAALVVLLCTWANCPDVEACFGTKLRLLCLSVGHEIPAAWAWFLCKTRAKVIQFVWVILPTVYVWRGLLDVGIHSLSFLERTTVKWLGFYKKKTLKKRIKNIFKKLLQKNIKLIILHVLQLFEKNVEEKIRVGGRWGNGSSKRLCL